MSVRGWRFESVAGALQALRDIDAVSAVGLVAEMVVKDDPMLTEDDVAKFCRQNFTGYKIPKYIEFRDDLPKSNVGKILRRELRAGK